MKEREDGLRAAWLKEEEERRGHVRWTGGNGLGLALRPADSVYLNAAFRREEASREAFSPLSEGIMATSRHAPLHMPKPECIQPFNEAASLSIRPFREAASPSTKPFGEAASLSTKPFIDRKRRKRIDVVCLRDLRPG
jgi:hypothetical protein